MGKNKVSTSRRPSVGMENGHINGKSLNLLIIENVKCSYQLGTDNFPPPHHYGKTLNVPDMNNVPHAVPVTTPPAPINPPRPAIMTTPKSSVISVKNPSTSIALSPTETRPLLLVTTENDHHQPKTVTVPNGRRLPLSGPITSRLPLVKQSSGSANAEHQTIRETTTDKLVSKKYMHNRPRTALFFSSTSMKKKQMKKFFVLIDMTSKFRST